MKFYLCILFIPVLCNSFNNKYKLPMNHLQLRFDCSGSIPTAGDLREALITFINGVHLISYSFVMPSRWNFVNI